MAVISKNISAFFYSAGAEQESIPGQRRLLPWYGLLVLILVPIYLKTILPGLGFWGDSAVYQFVGRVLGTPHAPGNPLYVVLNRLFISLAPVGSVAYRVNLLSMVFSLATSLAFFYLLVLLRLRIVIAFSTVLTFALSYTMWLNSLVAEVYIACLFCFVLLLVLLLEWRRRQKMGYFYLACLIYALSFGLHQLMLVFLPTFAWLVWKIDRRVFKSPKAILAVAAFILLGIGQYAYVIWRTNDPSTVYLATDTDSLFAFFRNPGLRTAFHLSFWELLRQRLPGSANLLWSNFSLLIALAVLGIFQVKDRVVNIGLLLLALTNILLVAQLDFAEAGGTYLAALLALAVYMGFGLDYILRRFFTDPRLAWAFLLIPLLVFGVNYRQVDQSQHVLHAQVVKNMLARVDEQSLIIADQYEYAAYIWYYLFAEGHAARGLYTQPDFDIEPEQVLRHLRGEGQIYLRQQRMELPYGYKVYVMRSAAERFDIPGLDLVEAGKYLFEIRLDQAQGGQAQGGQAQGGQAQGGQAQGGQAQGLPLPE